MTVTCMGRVNVATPGTLVRLSTDPEQRVTKILVTVIPGLTGKGYLGNSGLNRTTLAGVVRVLWPNTAGGLSDQFEIHSSDGSNSIPLAEYAIDMDVAGEGLLISYWSV